ncbi:uncharacterized protein LOC117831718 [Xyrichtys novacula]|uniref:Uncharacterized protein LOC117831718 n=1 Tax=Xyrichtys novacula TaxID=13765 RepID=A0AAV1GTT6_XYRNO|nr:uncharacterized protein LOC117831718 [Xyrichtys novacula]
MSTADQLLEEMYTWIEQREQCARKLKTLAQELESLREKCNASECIGTTTAVVGTAFLIGAGVTTLLTGGAAAPLLGIAGGVCSGVGVGISVITKITEHLLSSDTMKDAQRIERKGNEVSENIQKLFQRLKKETQRASSSSDPNDLDQEIMNEILKAMARRSGLQHHFILHMLGKRQHHFGAGLGGPMFNQSTLMITLGSILSFFTLKASGDIFKLMFVKGGQQLAKEVSKVGLKTALKGGAMAVGGVIGLAFELPEAIDQWKELVSNNHVTEASQSLRDTAEDLQKITKTLREQLDKIKEILKDLEKLKSYIENSDRSHSQKQDFINIVKRYCDNKDVLAWLSETYDTDIFFKLVDIFYFLKQELDKKKKKTDREEIDIIFVAHGSIEDPLIMANSLLPLSTIEDVYLYSPWNCAIDAYAAYGIATGLIEPKHRIFGCIRANGCRIPDNGHYPANLPYYWNSMKNTGVGLIPNILVSPLKDPEDDAWNGFVFLQNTHGEPRKNRVVIPFIVPRLFSNFVTIPLYVVTLALSLVLFIFPFKATFHLAACLSRDSDTTLNGFDAYLNGQYSCTIDHSMMSSSMRLYHANPGLYNALRAVFDH